MSNWRIKEIFSPKYNKTLYIPQQKGWFFYSSLKSWGGRCRPFRAA